MPLESIAAIEDFKKAIKTNPHCPRCYLTVGYIHLRSGDFDEATHNADEALLQADSDAERAVAYSLKGQALFTLGKPDTKVAASAEAQFRKALELAPDTAVFHFNLARALMGQAKDDEAVAELKQCLALKADAPTVSMAKKYLADPKRGREELAPDFEITTAQGDHLTTQQLAGKIVVVDFWATWCPACRESVPELKQLAKKYSDRLVLISVSGDDDDRAWHEFITKHEMNWYQCRDSNHKLSDAFDIHVFPSYYVIDAEGIVRKKIFGMDPQDSIVTKLRDFLAAAPQLAAK